jgi:hypothetical protein
MSVCSVLPEGIGCQDRSQFLMVLPPSIFSLKDEPEVGSEATGRWDSFLA